MVLPSRLRAADRQPRPPRRARPGKSSHRRQARRLGPVGAGDHVLRPGVAQGRLLRQGRPDVRRRQPLRRAALEGPDADGQQPRPTLPGEQGMGRRLRPTPVEDRQDHACDRVVLRRQERTDDPPRLRQGPGPSLRRGEQGPVPGKRLEAFGRRGDGVCEGRRREGVCPGNEAALGLDHQGQVVPGGRRHSLRL